MQDGNVLWSREVVNLFVHWSVPDCCPTVLKFRFRILAKQAGGSSSLPPEFLSKTRS